MITTMIIVTVMIMAMLDTLITLIRDKSIRMSKRNWKKMLSHP